MATKAHTKQRLRATEQGGFEVTVEQVIGEVVPGQDANLSLTEAAFGLIARWGSEGVFSFPLGPSPEDGTARVEVTFSTGTAAAQAA